MGVMMEVLQIVSQSWPIAGMVMVLITCLSFRGDDTLQRVEATRGTDGEQRVMVEGMMAVTTKAWNEAMQKTKMDERERCVKILQRLRMSEPLNMQADSQMMNAIELITEEADYV